MSGINYQYVGIRGPKRVAVTVDGRPLDPRFDMRNHSPDGFEWGYGGSGPAQLALAICAHQLRNDERARRIYQLFKFAVIGRLDKDKWILTGLFVYKMIRELEEGQKIAEEEARRALANH